MTEPPVTFMTYALLLAGKATSSKPFCSRHSRQTCSSKCFFRTQILHHNTLSASCTDQDGVRHPGGSEWSPLPCVLCVCRNGHTKCLPQQCPQLDCALVIRARASVSVLTRARLCVCVEGQVCARVVFPRRPIRVRSLCACVRTFTFEISFYA